MNSPMRVDRQTGQGVLADVAVTHSNANESAERIIGHHAATCFARRNWQSSRGIILRLCAYVDALYIPVSASSVAGRKKFCLSKHLIRSPSEVASSLGVKCPFKERQLTIN